jgi:tRNA threonylcarbamoyladenosine modification (KEOPS) complex Cgi121 subunit
MSYPTILDRKSVHMNATDRGIECLVALSSVKQIKVAIATTLLGLSDENEADIFIEIAERQAGYTGNGYGQMVPA